MSDTKQHTVTIRISGDWYDFVGTVLMIVAMVGISFVAHNRGRIAGYEQCSAAIKGANRGDP